MQNARAGKLPQGVLHGGKVQRKRTFFNGIEINSLEESEFHLFLKKILKLKALYAQRTIRPSLRKIQTICLLFGYKAPFKK